MFVKHFYTFLPLFKKSLHFDSFLFFAKVFQYGYFYGIIQGAELKIVWKARTSIRVGCFAVFGKALINGDIASPSIVKLLQRKAHRNKQSEGE